MSDQTIGTWPNDHAPLQNVPLTSSDERMHEMNEDCWCGPNVLAEGQGEDFRILEIAHRRPASGERDHVHDGTDCWCGPTIESFGAGVAPLRRPIGPGAATAAAPTIGRIVVYRSKTGKYVVPAVIAATVDTLYRPAVEEGHVAELTDESHVHLVVFTPGFAGHRNSTTTPEQAAKLTALSTPAGGTYQEFDIAYDETGETPGTWSWPRRV
jgi:hypothetical protein